MVAGTIEKIQVRLELLTKGFTSGMKATTAGMQKLNKGVNAQAHAFTKLSQKQKIMRVNTRMNKISQQGFFKTMRMGREEFKGFNEQGRKFTTIGGRTANAIRKSTHGMKGFRMEMLGVMFFGMMLQRTFSGLIKTSLEWMGVMEVFSLALGILFLPVAELLLKWALKFLQWVSELTPVQKKLIGTFVLMGIAIGGLLFIIGSFALGIGSLIIAFKFLFSPIGAILGLLLALAGVSIFGMLDGFTKEVEGAGTTLAGFGITGETLTKVKDKIMQVITKVKDTIVENLPAILEKGKEILTKIVKGISDNKEKIAEVMEDILVAMGEWVADNLQDFIDIGVTIGKAIAKGVAISAFKIGEAIGEASVRLGERIGENIRTNIRMTPGERARAGLPNFQAGGIVPETGPIFAHKGETVVPANRSAGGITFNITNNISGSNVDELDRLIKENNLQLVEEVKREIAI